MTVWAVDIETTGLVPWVNSILGIGVASGPQFRETKYYTGASMRAIVKYMYEHNVSVIGHNITFDKGWLDYHYPEYPLDWVADTGVLSQMYDNSDSVHGFGLKDSAQRLLGVDAHEEELQVWVLSNVEGAKKSNYRGFMAQVPVEIVAKYCRYDCLYTYRLYELLTSQVQGWEMYMSLFLAEVDATIQQQRYGIRVNLQGVTDFHAQLSEQHAAVENEFANHPEIAPHIQLVQQRRHEAEIAKRLAKSKTGKIRALEFDTWNEKNPFNIGSDAQLLQVFNSQGVFYNPVTKQFQYPYLTDGGKASLSQDFIGLYGVGGRVLSKQGEIGSLIIHCKHLIDETVDGRVHPSINLIGSKSGRVTASGMNILAVPFEEADYANNFLADDGCVFFTCDFLSLEPSVLANLSNDRRMKITCSPQTDLPAYDDEGFLCVDDLYILVGSRTSFAGAEIKEMIDPHAWMQNSDACKKLIKPTRNMLKSIILAIAYGAGPRKIQMTIYKRTKQWLPIIVIQETIDTYYRAFPRVRAYGIKLAQLAQSQGRFVNPFGFPLSFTPRELNQDEDGETIPKWYKSINRICQSTAQGVMKLMIHALQQRLRHEDPNNIRFVIANFHDAFFLSVRETYMDRCREIVDESLDDVNTSLAKLGWEIPMRLSAGFGRTLHAAKIA